jgi:hypothetical protein
VSAAVTPRTVASCAAEASCVPVIASERVMRRFLELSSCLALLACAPEGAPDQASDLGRAPAPGDSAPLYQDLETAARAPGDTALDITSSGGGTAAPGAQPEAVMPAYGLGREPARRVELAADLAEVSGLAFAADGRLFAHGDEGSTVWALDPASGAARGRFGLADGGSAAGTGRDAKQDGGDAKGNGKKGKKGNDDEKGGKGGKRAAQIPGAARGDFEDVRVVGDRIWLLSSDGTLWEAPIGADDRLETATRHRAAVDAGCREFEGLEYDPGSKSLLLLCKVPESGAWRGRVVVLAWSPERRALADRPRVSVPAASLARLTGASSFKGSAIAREPRSGHYLLVAGPEKTWIELGPGGEVLAGGRLDQRRHPQPEGLAFAPNGELLVSDEAAGGTAAIAVYRRH